MPPCHTAGLLIQSLHGLLSTLLSSEAGPFVVAILQRPAGVPQIALSLLEPIGIPACHSDEYLPLLFQRSAHLGEAFNSIPGVVFHAILDDLSQVLT